MARDVRTFPIGRLIIVAAALAALVVLFVALRPTFGGPQDRTFDVSITETGMTPREIEVVEGDRVTLRLSADRQTAFHLHGYDLKADIRPDAPATLEFRADQTGRFEIEDETTEEELGVLIVEPR